MDNVQQDATAGVNDSPQYLDFDLIVGQERLKDQMKFYIDGYYKTNRMPNLLMVAPRGTGKNFLTETLAKNLVPEVNGVRNPKGKGRLLINSSTIKTVNQFWQKLVVKYLANESKHYSIIFDECHALSEPMTLFLLTILNPNPQGRNYYEYDNMGVTFDFRRLTFFFLTTEGHLVFHALQDRLHRIEIPEYRISDLAQILQNSTEAKFDSEETLLEAASVVRVNPRNALKLGENITSYCKIHNVDNFTTEHWLALKQQLGINPLGLSKLEFDYLHLLLQANDAVRLNNMAAKMSLQVKVVQRDIEVYLNKLGLIETVAEGRKITKKGVKLVEGVLAKDPNN